MRFLAWSRSAVHSANETAGGPPPGPRGMAEFEREVARAGVAIECGVLKAGTGAKFTRTGDSITVTHGPFAHAGEPITGYAILEVKSREEAVEWGKRFFKASGGATAYIAPLTEG